MNADVDAGTGGAARGSSFLAEAPATVDAERLYRDDVEQVGYVMNLSKLWAYQPHTIDGLFELLRECVHGGELTFRQRGILISACASSIGDAYCSLAWGARLSGEAGAGVAASVLRGEDIGLDDAERALAHWARHVARDPNGTSEADVDELRVAGFTDAQIFAITVFVALRCAFSTVNDALGARPDHELVESAPNAVRAAVAFGRPADTI